MAEPGNCLGWKRPPRPSSPTLDPALLQNHVLKCHSSPKDAAILLQVAVAFLETITFQCRRHTKPSLQRASLLYRDHLSFVARGEERRYLPALTGARGERGRGGNEDKRCALLPPSPRHTKRPAAARGARTGRGMPVPGGRGPEPGQKAAPLHRLPPAGGARRRLPRAPSHPIPLLPSLPCRGPRREALPHSPV